MSIDNKIVKSKAYKRYIRNVKIKSIAAYETIISDLERNIIRNKNEIENLEREVNELDLVDRDIPFIRDSDILK